MSIFNNIYLSNMKNQLIHFKDNSYIKKVTSDFETIDSIKDYKLFKKAVSEYKAYVGKRDRIFSFVQYGGEGLYYGHRKAFFEYAGESNSKNSNYLLPYFEHGINWQEQDFPFYSKTNLHSLVFQGRYKNEMIHKKRPNLPIYNIGPYVYYAKPYYTKKFFETTKQKNGKTLLLYPLHTCEGATAEYDRAEFVKKIVDRFKMKYNTIMISVYWNDIDDPLYDAFEAEGMQLVSAGYRGDQKFISRLRTIIELSDMTAGNHLGTHIGYCLALNKGHVIFNVNAQANESFRHLSGSEQRVYEQTLELFYKAFAHNQPNAEDKKLQSVLFDKYWGGINCIKSVEEAKRIISLSGKLLEISRGNALKISNIIDNLHKDVNYSDFTIDEIKLLKEATGCINKIG